ncbi:MAG: JAB domain-containing protein [Pseudoflavonifractor sp.]
MSIHEGHRKRTKAEFLARPESFPDHKLLELLLFYANPRGDTNPIAHALLERFGSLSGILDAAPEALEQVPCVGEHAATLLAAVKELGRRYATQRASVEDIVDSRRDVLAVFRPLFYGARSEKVFLLCMDGKGKLLGCPKVGEGTVNAAEITTRLIVETALNHNAAQVILAHNHVAGIALPSPEDRATTLYLREVLRQVGVVLKDHLIFVDDDMVSMAESGLLT